MSMPAVMLAKQIGCSASYVENFLKKHEIMTPYKIKRKISPVVKVNASTYELWINGILFKDFSFENKTEFQAKSRIWRDHINNIVSAKTYEIIKTGVMSKFPPVDFEDYIPPVDRASDPPDLYDKIVPMQAGRPPAEYSNHSPLRIAK